MKYAFCRPSVRATIVHATAKPDVPASIKLLTTLGPTVINAEPIAADVRVALVDRFDNAAPVNGVAITASVAGGGRHELRGTATATTDESGVAAFSQLAILGDTGSASLVFQAASLMAASASFRVVPGAPVRVVATSVPTSAMVTTVMQISARVTDVSGNPVGPAARARYLHDESASTAAKRWRKPARRDGARCAVTLPLSLRD
jgi:hypothetical protein